MKHVYKPVSSDGMIMRTSFKVRFEVSKLKFFNDKKEEIINVTNRDTNKFEKMIKR